MKPTALIMAIVVVGIGVGTYFALALVPPGVIPGVNVPNTETDDVEVPTIQTVPARVPDDGGRASAAPGDDDLAAEDSDETAAADDSDGASTSSDYASSEEIERALANEPPPEDGYLDSAGDAGSAREMDDAAGEESKVAEAEEDPEPAKAKPAPKPDPKPASKPAPKPEPKPAPAKTAAAKPEPKPAVEKTAAAKSEPKAEPAPPKQPTAAGSDALKPWWPDASSMPDNQLKLVYAGQVKGQLAIALLFSDKLKIDTLRENAEVKATDGSTVSTGEWQLGNNPKLAVYSGIKPGRYTVVLSPRITGQSGFMLGTQLQGPVYVKAP